MCFSCASVERPTRVIWPPHARHLTSSCASFDLPSASFDLSYIQLTHVAMACYLSAISAIWIPAMTVAYASYLFLFFCLLVQLSLYFWHYFYVVFNRCLLNFDSMSFGISFRRACLCFCSGSSCSGDSASFMKTCLSSEMQFWNFMCNFFLSLVAIVRVVDSCLLLYADR